MPYTRGTDIRGSDHLMLFVSNRLPMKNNSSVTQLPISTQADDREWVAEVQSICKVESGIELRVFDELSDVQKAVADNLENDRLRITRPMLSVVIPVYNERESVIKIVEAVKRLPVSKQIIIVDDGSTDGTQEALLGIPQDGCVELFFHCVNQGKGAALQTGFRLTEGNIVIVQDADLEYDPQDIMKVIQPIIDGRAVVVYGSRYLNSESENSSWIHRAGNASLTGLSNWITGQKLTDMETCYKAFRRDVLQNIRIEQPRFGFEPEITAKISRLGIQIPEVPISYRARSWADGKKIGLKDLWNAIYCILRYR
jgi:glycosyltransferase involved in cell wall biosynthesis